MTPVTQSTFRPQSNVVPFGACNKTKFGTASDAQVWGSDVKAEVADAVKNQQLLFWDVDTQIGFIRNIMDVVKDGVKYAKTGLPVGGADQILDKFAKLTGLHTLFGIPLVSTMDTHTVDDVEHAEFTAFTEKHCVKHWADWYKDSSSIPKLRNGQEARPAFTIDVEQSIADVPTRQKIKAAIAAGKGWFVLEKNTNSAFQVRVQNPAKEEYLPNEKTNAFVANLKALGYQTAVVYGLATDFCVMKAVKGLKEAGMKVLVVSDAMKGIFTQDESHIADPTKVQMPDFAAPRQQEFCDVYGDTSKVQVMSTDELASIVAENAPRQNPITQLLNRIKLAIS